MRRELCAYLQDVLDAADNISAYTSGLTLNSLQDAGGGVVFDAVVLKLLVIGEALNQASIQFPGSVDTVSDMKSIIGQRNRLIHGYFDIDSRTVWDTVQEDLPN